MYESSERVRRNKTKKPKDKKDNSNGIQHGIGSLM